MPLLKAVVVPDIHVPFHDPRAVKAALEIVRAEKPDVVVLLGDLVDCWQISDFDKDIERVDSLGDNIGEAREMLAAFRRAAPRADVYCLEGNHEDRLRRLIWRAPKPLQEVLKLDDIGLIGKTGGWRKILRLDSLHIQWVGLNDQTKTLILPKIIVKHGTLVSKWSAHTAKSEWMKYGRSGISGHTHRLGAFYHRDHNGRAVWIEAGCLCDVNPVYCDDPDWQQGVVVLTWSADRKVMGEKIVGIRKGEYVL